METVKIHYKMQRWEHWNDSFCVHILLFLLLEAKDRTTTYKGVKILRGQVVATRGFVSKGTGINEGIVKNRMYKLASDNTISLEVKTSGKERFTVVTINNFETYQCEEKSEKQKPKTDYQQRVDSARKQPYSEEFEKWWSSYMVGGKGASWFGWCDTENKPPVDELIKLTERYKVYCQENERKLIDGQGFLRQRYFDSEWKVSGISEIGGKEEKKRFDAGYNKSVILQDFINLDDGAFITKHWIDKYQFADKVKVDLADMNGDEFYNDYKKSADSVRDIINGWFF
jgi:hypothetical protein